MGALSIATLLTIALLDGQVPHDENRSWLVAYEQSGDGMTRMLMGTFEIVDDVVHYRSLSREVAWDVKLEDITATHVETVNGPARQVHAIVIECVENGQLVRKRMAPVNWDMTFLTPAPLARMISLRLEEQRSAKARSREQ